MKQSILNKLKLKWKDNGSVDSIDFNDEYPWLKQNFTREDSENELIEKDIGVFLIRKSETIQNCYVLSVKVPKYINSTTISHYLIECNKKEFKIRGFKKLFPSLSALVLHCSLIRDQLPVVLNTDYYANRRNAKKFNEFAYYSSSSSIGSYCSDASTTTTVSHRSIPLSVDDFEF